MISLLNTLDSAGGRLTAHENNRGQKSFLGNPHAGGPAWPTRRGLVTILLAAALVESLPPLRPWRAWPPTASSRWPLGLAVGLGLGWAGLGWALLCWAGLRCAALGWGGLGLRVGSLGWAGLGWGGRGRPGLVWSGLVWSGLGWGWGWAWLGRAGLGWAGTHLAGLGWAGTHTHSQMFMIEKSQQRNTRYICLGWTPFVQ